MVTQIEDIYNTYFKDVFLYVYSLSGDKHIAEDITSETFMKALTSLDSFRGDSDIRVWLCQIAKNSYYSYLGKKKNFVDLKSLPESASEDNVEQEITTSQASMKVHEIIQNLKEPYKKVFTLRVFGELSFKQIGKLYAKSDNWACVTYHRAREKIKARLGDYR
ncbi:RNA polymerase sigma factor [Mesobacillus selenatarsenatis]|uniref:RNA polymerase sigma-70 factor, ECF subfamily n=1 Tax=Mesobacillus selenatarsenatis (strain DSM 18680 / JCM 14380 / FERM P-15431 / SF-1) TaxID=1321606 RepID=A0A0A8WXU7_MESS1|nr:sigma-70 family RNA polymerase sigma factor [Mesobacillus selenatarsenatis]GAM12443.1 RNA polymerase sigma-70 factor, ECF subfamily [Mesobacillus selenatarsenatis SF-1]